MLIGLTCHRLTSGALQGMRDRFKADQIENLTNGKHIKQEKGNVAFKENQYALPRPKENELQTSKRKRCLLFSIKLSFSS